MESKGENLGEAPVVPTGWTVLLRAVLQVAARDSLGDYTITIAHNLGRSFSGYMLPLCSTYVYLHFQLFAFANHVFHFCGAAVDPHSAFLRYRRCCGQLGNYGSLGASARYVRCGDCIFCAVLEKIWELYMGVFLGCIYGGTKVVPKWGIWWDLAQNYGRFAAIKHKCLRLAFLFLVPWAIKRLGNDNEQY